MLPVRTPSHRTDGLFSLSLLLGLLFMPGAAMAQENLSYADLVRRMLDTERLAVLPEPGETTAQQSSYDRASRYDADTDSYIHWGAAP